MSIGQGDGDDKAMKAVEQALHHPLLQSTSIGNAAGILVNFTSGGELGLHDVQTALSYLQAQAGGRAEIVMGVVNDARLEDRVEVILVVTGLGSTTLEETLSHLDVRKPIVGRKPVSIPLEYDDRGPQLLPNEDLEDELSISTSDLDIPAFLRRGRRLAVKATG